MKLTQAETKTSTLGWKYPY